MLVTFFYTEYKTGNDIPFSKQRYPKNNIDVSPFASFPINIVSTFLMSCMPLVWLDAINNLFALFYMDMLRIAVIYISQTQKPLVSLLLTSEIACSDVIIGCVGM